MSCGLIEPAKNPIPVSELPILRNSMKASECKCVECGKQAVAFWPMIDPDIPAHPYCRKCLDNAKAQVLINTFGYSPQKVKTIVKANNKLNHKNE